MSSRIPNGTSGSSHNKGSQRSRAQQQELLDDQLTDWWSATVLGDNPYVSDDGSKCSLGWEYTKEELTMTSRNNNTDDNTCASDEHGSQSSSSGWEFTMEERSMTSATGGNNNACVSHDGSAAASQSSHGWEFNMEELSMSSATGGDNPCVSDDSRFLLLSEFTMEEFETTSANDNNSCTKDDDWKNIEKRPFILGTASSRHQTKQSCQEQTGEN
jgi:hypothetical protein